MGVAKIFRRTEEPTVDRETVKTWQVMDTDEVPHISMAIMFKKQVPDGYMSENKEIDISYMVISDEGEINLDGGLQKLKRGDVIYLPRNTKYAFSEGIEVVAASTPRFGSQK